MKFTPKEKQLIEAYTNKLVKSRSVNETDSKYDFSAKGGYDFTYLAQFVLETIDESNLKKQSKHYDYGDSIKDVKVVNQGGVFQSKSGQKTIVFTTDSGTYAVTVSSKVKRVR